MGRTNSTYEKLPFLVEPKLSFKEKAAFIKTVQKMYRIIPTRYSCAGHPERQGEMFYTLKSYIVMDYNKLVQRLVDKHFTKEYEYASTDTTYIYRDTDFNIKAHIQLRDPRQATFGITPSKDVLFSQKLKWGRGKVSKTNWKRIRRQGFNQLFQLMNDTLCDFYKKRDFRRLGALGCAKTNGIWKCGDLSLSTKKCK